jgi:hypothetical protein
VDDPAGRHDSSSVILCRPVRPSTSRQQKEVPEDTGRPLRSNPSHIARCTPGTRFNAYRVINILWVEEKLALLNSQK